MRFHEIKCKTLTEKDVGKFFMYKNKSTVYAIKLVKVYKYFLFETFKGFDMREFSGPLRQGDYDVFDVPYRKFIFSENTSIVRLDPELLKEYPGGYYCDLIYECLSYYLCKKRHRI